MQITSGTKAVGTTTFDFFFSQLLAVHHTASNKTCHLCLKKWKATRGSLMERRKARSVVAAMAVTENLHNLEL